MEITIVNDENRIQLAREAKPVVLAIGFFDGVHLGHQRVIQTAKKIAEEKQLKLAVMTFAPHPKEVLSASDERLPYVTPHLAKMEIFHSLHVDICYVVAFTKELSALSPKTFVEQYLVAMQVKHVVAGFDFTYGVKGSGNMKRLRKDSNERLAVTTVGKVVNGGRKISSTRIRQLIRGGAVAELPFYLGRNYSLKGTVYLNQQTGYKKIVPFPLYALPRKGVYQVSIQSLKGEVHTSIFVNGHHLMMKQADNECLKHGDEVIVVWKDFISAKLEVFDLV